MDGAQRGHRMGSMGNGTGPVRNWKEPNEGKEGASGE
jgi:hypothetical protein